MEKIKLEAAFVAFLDVLGFKELVKKSKDVDKFFDIALNNFKIISDYKSNIRKLILSDSIILVIDSVNDKKENFVKLLRAIRNLQADLALEDIWVRGAISYGDVYLNKPSGDEAKDEKIIYGDGFIRAYEMEKDAVFPRVIIDPRIIRFISGTRSEFIQSYSCLLSGDPVEENLASSLDIERLEEDFVFAMPGDRNRPDDDLFVSYGSRLLYQQLRTQSCEHLFTIYKNLRGAMYKEHKHFSKYSWAKKYFWELLNAAEHRIRIAGAKYLQVQGQLDEFYKL